MSKVKIGIVILILLTILSAVILGYGPKKAVSPTAVYIEVGDELIASVFSVVGERKISKSLTTNSQDENRTEITYDTGAITIDDINEYISKLVNMDAYHVTKQAGNDGKGQTYQISKAAGKTDDTIIINFYFVDGAETSITYTLSGGLSAP